MTKLPLAAATAALTSAQFTVGPTAKAFSDTVPVGTVISQSPAAAHRARKFSVVTLVVSKGVDLVTVPSIPSLDPASDAEARSRLPGCNGTSSGSSAAETDSWWA